MLRTESWLILLGNEHDVLGFAVEPLGDQATMTTATLSTAEGTRLERRKARTRAAILSAASTLFQKQGFEETSIQQIAELADTGVGTLYGYFASKDDLLREVLRTHSAEAVERYRTGLPKETPALEKLTRALEIFAQYIQDNRRLLVAAFYVSTRDGRVNEEGNQWLMRAYTELLREGIERGEFKDLPVETTARMLLSSFSNAVLGLGIWKGRENEPETVRELLEVTRALVAR